MKPSPEPPQEIVRRAWDQLNEAPFGYVPLGRPADGFYGYAGLSRGYEWSLINAVRAQMEGKSKG